MRKKILIVDDEAINREILKQIFEQDYDIIMAKEGKEAIEFINRYQNDLAIVLLDLIMPVINGYQVLHILNANGMIKKIPVIMITANTDTKIALSCYSLGAADIINKPFVAQIVRQRILNTIEMYEDRDSLKKLLEQSNEKLTERERQLEQFYDRLMDAISNIVEFRDTDSGMHVKRVKGLTQLLACTYQKLYPEENITDEQVHAIVRTSALHDIGKIAIPDSILLKPGKLNPDEWEIMKSHTTRGCDILAMLENVQDSDQYKTAYDIIRHHHERYDGTGYPDGLKGDNIPLAAQLVAIVDVYDALVSDRIYKKAYTKEKAYSMITNGECGVFSDKILACFEHARKVIELFSDTHQ